ncbi:hypothetical protein R6Q59_013199 [Mikania micrantha]
MKEELYALSNEMQSSFCSTSVDELNSNVKNKESNLHLTISIIMSRFYPGMKIGEIFSLVEKKPGYDSYVTDLHISKSSRASPLDKINEKLNEIIKDILKEKEENERLNGIIAELETEKEKHKAKKDAMSNRMSKIEDMLKTLIRK